MSDPDARWGLEREDEPSRPSPLMMATAQLLELASAVRGPAWRDQLAPALVAAQDAGWDWERRGRAACRLIFDASAEPRALTDATRDPVKRQERGDYTAGAAAVREALERARAGQ
jgi:hypothetical protein